MHNLPSHGHPPPPPPVLGTPGSPAAYAKHRSFAPSYEASPITNRFGGLIPASPEVKTVCPQPQRPQANLLSFPSTPFFSDPSSPGSPSSFDDGLMPKAQPSSWGESRPLSSVSTSAGPTPGVEDNWHHANRQADTGIYNLQNSTAYQQAMHHVQVPLFHGHENPRPLSALSSSTRATPNPEESWQGSSPEQHNRASRFRADEAPYGRGEGHPPQDRKIFVGGVPQDMNQDELYSIFSEYSGVKKAWLQKCKPPANTTPAPPPQNHRGFGFVIFHDADAVDKLFDPNHQDVKWKDGDMSRYISIANGKKIEVKRAISSNKMPDNRLHPQAPVEPAQGGKGRAPHTQHSSGRSTPFSPPPIAHPMSPLQPRFGGGPAAMPPGNFVPGQRPGGLALGPGRPGPVLASTQPPRSLPQWPPQQLPLAAPWSPVTGGAPTPMPPPADAYTPPMVPPMPGQRNNGMVAVPVAHGSLSSPAQPMQQPMQMGMYVMPNAMQQQQQPSPMGMPNGMAMGMPQTMHQGTPSGLQWMPNETQFPQVGEMELRAASPLIYED